MGFDLKAWTAKPGKRFIYNEFALGGGISECGDTPAKTRAEAGRFPWLGGTSTFTQAINPWCVLLGRSESGGAGCNVVGWVVGLVVFPGGL